MNKEKRKIIVRDYIIHGDDGETFLFPDFDLDTRNKVDKKIKEYEELVDLYPNREEYKVILNLLKERAFAGTKGDSANYYNEHEFTELPKYSPKTHRKRREDRNNAYENKKFIGAIEDLSKLIDMNKKSNKGKLDMAKKILKKDDKRPKEIINTIFSLDLSLEEKTEVILSYGVLVDGFSKIHELSNEEIIMIAAATKSEEAYDYTFYAGILSDKRVSSSIINSTDEIEDQKKIAHSIMDNQDEYYDEDITPDNFEFLVGEALSKIPEKKKSK